ncbi:hypothetical protein [Rubritalea marina]|uniref:hypothetical protein n=1 Tax=Rubritalea marina TaxID=361055 RepID=UPI0003603DD9|nr:hypothetical protein [Rubritalea marina]
MDTPNESTPAVVDTNKHTIESKYWHHLLTDGKRPTSVYAFTQEIGIEEAEFYRVATSFEALEANYWEGLVSDTIAVLHKDDEYPSYPPEQKLLAFFFTFFLHAQKHRSRLVSYFPGAKNMNLMKPMRSKFIEFATEVVKEGVQDGSIADRKQLTTKYPHLLFEQLRAVVEFHKRDQSVDFQDTDALIEKSVRLGADIASTGTLDSALDLGRFLLGKWTHPTN